MHTSEDVWVVVKTRANVLHTPTTHITRQLWPTITWHLHLDRGASTLNLPCTLVISARHWRTSVRLHQLLLSVQDTCKEGSRIPLEQGWALAMLLRMNGWRCQILAPVSIDMTTKKYCIVYLEDRDDLASFWYTMPDMAW
jgi:hypothetical protein